MRGFRLDNWGAVTSMALRLGTLALITLSLPTRRLAPIS